MNNINVKEILINVMLRSGYETPHVYYHVDLWTLTKNNINNKELESKNMKRIRGEHYGQNSISFNSENMWFPIGNDNKLYYFIQDTPHSNCQGGHVQIIGWR